MSTTSMVVNICGGLALFLLGMKTMSEGLQKVAGQRLRQTLMVMTRSRLRGVGTGVMITSAIQSSSATTVMLVGFVHAGLLNLTQAVGVIMGANIGTTVTGWLVAILGFRIDITTMALPAIAVGFFIRFFGSRKLTNWSDVLVGFGLLFLGLDFMKTAVEGLRESATIMSWMSTVSAHTFLGRMIAVGVGTIVTFVIQSSSATMAITMTLAAQGIIDLPTACALILGENIGTTITANIASLGTSSAARRTARAHFLFNIFGAIWVMIIFIPFLNLVDLIVPGQALGQTGGPSTSVTADHLAGFHTTFNIINTLIFLPLAGKLAWLATRMVASSAEDDRASLKYLDTKLVPTSPLAIQAARNELERMFSEVEIMFDKVIEIIFSPHKKMGKIALAVQRSENIVDMLEKEITEYLVSTSRHDISREQSHEIAGILQAVSDIERMGDHCESLLNLAIKKYEMNLPFSDEAQAQIKEISSKVKEFIDLIKPYIIRPTKNFMEQANKVENAIDSLEKKMRADHVERLNERKCTVQSGLVFIDMLTSFEKMGDHSYNVAQMLSGVR
ncbi:MAG: Na/Pi cotransporter family protein [Deltaproteobacteria bacterium]|nr:Na/Pi cotransporter family protein [Deltaproteobacteria bacterium]